MLQALLQNLLERDQPAINSAEPHGSGHFSFLARPMCRAKAAPGYAAVAVTGGMGGSNADSSLILHYNIPLMKPSGHFTDTHKLANIHLNLPRPAGCTWCPCQ